MHRPACVHRFERPVLACYTALMFTTFLGMASLVVIARIFARRNPLLQPPSPPTKTGALPYLQYMNLTVASVNALFWDEFGFGHEREKRTWGREGSAVDAGGF